MLLIRFFILITLILSTTNIYAAWRAGSGSAQPTKQAACNDALQYVTPDESHGSATKAVVEGDYCNFLTSKDIKIQSSKLVQDNNTCEQKYDSGMFWGATSAPSTFCDGQCEWKVEKSSCGADYNQDGTFTGASSCAYDAQTNGNTCSQQTGTPQNPTPTPPPPNSPCGPGKTMGVINGTTICVNNSAPPPNCQKLPNGNYNCVPKDPNTPPNPPKDPNTPPTGGGSGGCTSNCNNTTNNNTTNNNTTNNTTNNTSITNNTTEAPAVDLSPVIDKLNQVDTGIKAVDTAIKAVGTGIKAVETAINTSSQTITNAVNAVKDKVTEVKNSVDQAKEQAKTDAATQKAATDAAKDQAKTDAATQKAATDAAKEQAKTDAKTQKDATDGVKKAVEDQTQLHKDEYKLTKEFRDWEKLQHTCTISANGTYLVDGKVTVNSKICDNVDSFEGYKKWIQGEGKDAQGNDLGIPANLPDGKINTGTGALTEYNMTGQEMEGNYINFGGSCPADVSIPINVGQGHGNITMSWKPMCDLAPMLRAVFIAMAYFSGAFIVLGVGKPTNSGA